MLQNIVIMDKMITYFYVLCIFAQQHSAPLFHLWKTFCVSATCVKSVVFKMGYEHKMPKRTLQIAMDRIRKC